MSDVKAPILIVDDREENLIALEAILQPLGQPCLRALSGHQALRQLLQHDVAVILMDVQMPGLTGLDTAAMIRERPKTAHVPIIFITALSRETQYVMNAYRTGAVDYLLKPLDPDMLRAKVSCFVDLFVHRELLRRTEAELAAKRLAEEEARRLAEFEEQLLGIVGHDLRGPLSAIRASAQAGLRAGANESAASAGSGLVEQRNQRAFERIERSTERMKHIVDVLLDFTRLRVGRGLALHPRERSLNELVQSVLDEFCTANPDVQVRLQATHPAVTGCWDGPRLEQVLWNLLDNAARYGDRTVPIQLGLGLDGETAFLEVRNHGPAIPPDQREALFEPYRRARIGPPRDGRGDGLGLGLYIIREIVVAHGGEIALASDAETGTAFTVSLPRSLPCDGSEQRILARAPAK